MRFLLTSFLLLTISAFAQNLEQGLIACYPLDGNSASNTYTTGAILNGQVNNGFAITGRNNQPATAIAFGFDTASYIRLPDNNLLKSQIVSFSGWFNINAIPYRQFLVFSSNGCGSNLEGYSLEIVFSNACNHHVFRVSKANSGCVYDPVVQVESTNLIPMQLQWYHIVFIIDQSMVYLYVNAILEGSASHNSPIAYAAGKEILIGASRENTSTVPFFGIVDDLRFYDRALTTAEINLLHSLSGSCFDAIPNAKFALSKNNICAQESVQCTDSSSRSPSSWSWTVAPQANPTTSTVKNPTFTFNSPGVYTISLVSTNLGGSSQVTTQTVNVSACNAISKVKQVQKISNLTTVASEKLKFTYSSSSNSTFVITDISGKVIKKETFTEAEMEVDVVDLADGMYYLWIEGERYFYKFIKQAL